MTAQEATIKLSPQSTGRQTQSVLRLQQQHSRSERGRRLWPRATCTPSREAPRLPALTPAGQSHPLRLWQVLALEPQAAQGLENFILYF